MSDALRPLLQFIFMLLVGQKTLEKMKRKHGAGWEEQVTYLVCIDVDPNKENQFCKEEAAAEVLVNCGSGALNLAEEPEGENAHGETNQ